MAGLGRRSHYRKHLTDSVLNDLPEPTNSNERIAKVVGTRGSNQFELVVAPPTVRRRRTRCLDNGGGEGEGEGEGEEKATDETRVEMNNLVEDKDLDTTPQLSILPTKYRKLIWLKRNDYVICECVEEDDETYENNEDKEDIDSNNNNNSSSNKNGTNNNEGGIRFMITHILYKDQIKNLKEKNIWPMHPFFLDGTTRNDDGEDDEGATLIEKAKELLKQERKMNAFTTSTYRDGIIHEDEYEEEEEDFGEEAYSDDDGIVFSNNNDYFVNTNRIAKLKIEDSSSEEDSD